MLVSADPSIEMLLINEQKRHYHHFIIVISLSRASSWSGWIWRSCTPSPTSPWSPSKNLPRPGRELNVVNSVGVVGGAEVDVVQALGNHPIQNQGTNH